MLLFTVLLDRVVVLLFIVLLDSEKHAKTYVVLVQLLRLYKSLSYSLSYFLFPSLT